MAAKIVAPVLLLLVLSAAVLADCDLRSRGFAGFTYRDIAGGDRDSLGLPGLEGVIITLVVPGSASDQAGLVKGDIVTSLDRGPVRDGSDLIGTLRSYYAGDGATVAVLRNGETLALPLIFASNRETGEDVDVEYTCFESGGTRLRAVVTSPLGEEGKRLPAILIVSALGSPRFSGLSYYNMGRVLAHTFSQKGFRTLRFELRGAGDSEGEDYRTTDFMTEVEDNLAALDYLMQRPDVDRGRVFVMGHSTGGMIGAVMASRRDLAGLVVSCTIGRTFYERMLETLRFQGEMAGDSPEALDRNLKDYLDLTVGVARGDSLSVLVAGNPNIAAFVNAAGRIMDDRNTDYWRQQLNLNMSETYSEVQEPVLIIYAASDFLTELACHEHIRDVLVASGNGDVTLDVIPGVDHAYSYAEDKEASYRTYQTRDFRGSPEPIDRIVAWLKERVQ
jgi:pimeloyl-ACP methyl ester carboxylesterase